MTWIMKERRGEKKMRKEEEVEEERVTAKRKGREEIDK